MFQEGNRYLTEAISLDEMAQIIAEEDLGIVPVTREAQLEIDVPLRVRRWRLNLTKNALTKQAGISHSTISLIESLKIFPEPDTADKIAKALDCDPNELFPQWQKCLTQGRELPQRRNEISIDKVDEAKEGVMSLSESLPDLEGYIEQVDLEDGINAVLAVLNEREKLVLILHMGLQGNQQLSLEAIGEGLGVTRERVRQIECRALRKLQNPSKKRYLKDFVPKNNKGMGEKAEALQNGLINALYNGDQARVNKIAKELEKRGDLSLFLIPKAKVGYQSSPELLDKEQAVHVEIITDQEKKRSFWQELGQKIKKLFD